MTKLPLTTLTAISPSDGRYAKQTDNLKPLFSEYGLIHYRLKIEIEWLKILAAEPTIQETSPLSEQAVEILERLSKNFTLEQAEEIKRIEKKINHDVKSVEYFLSNEFKNNPELSQLQSFIHFACTSEDINNLSWACILKQGRNEILLPAYHKVLEQLLGLAKENANLPMISRTHGQVASPTTVGKEFANFSHRLHTQITILNNISICGKFNGAVGNFNAHHFAYAQINWLSLSQQLIRSINIQPLDYTTQIEPHDYIAELLDAIRRSNTVLIDLCRDIWGYIMLEYFKLKIISAEVGSSTMPHKVNPIDFENAEGNLGIANALAQYLSNNLPISRWQRDLTDSTSLRNLGLVFSHTLIALNALSCGINKIIINEIALQQDLDIHWEVLTEAIQTILRKHNVSDAYERMKDLTRGKKNIDANTLHMFIKTLPIPKFDKERLINLTPATYIGIASELVNKLKI